MMRGVDSVDHDAMIAKLAADLAGLVTFTKAEQIGQGPDGKHAEWLDHMLDELEPMAEWAYDLDTSRAIRHLFGLHGNGPWTTRQITKMTGRDKDSVHRVLVDLTKAGILTANHPDETT